MALSCASAQQIGVHSAMGFLATDEEVALVSSTGVDVRQGFTHQLPLPDACASVVVCNNVLLIIPRAQIPASLNEICRIAKPDARIFIGEIPYEQPVDPTPQFRSRGELLSHLYRKQGLRAWLGMLRRMIWWQLTGKPTIIRPGTAVTFFATKEEFTALASNAGMAVLRCWQHESPKNRNNYLLRKISLA
jgi:SAM-dependent methyltransferase